jgi:hypothetical protein
MDEIEELSKKRRAWANMISIARTEAMDAEVETLRNLFIDAKRQCRKSYKAWCTLLRELKPTEPAIQAHTS